MLSIVTLVILGVAAAIIVSSALDSRSNAKRRAELVEALPGGDSAVSRYETALNAGLLGNWNSYEPTLDGMNSLPSKGGLKVINNTNKSYNFPSWVNDVTYHNPALQDPNSTSTTSITMLEPAAAAGPHERLFWQAYRVFPPDKYRRVYVYFRSWKGRKTASGWVHNEPRYVHASFRPGSFADFQMLINGEIPIESGANIAGNMHSNSQKLESKGGPCDKCGIYWNTPGSGTRPSCSPGSVISTATQAIDGLLGPGGGGNCELDAKNNRTIELGKVSEVYNEALGACGITKPSGPITVCRAGAGWAVELQGTQALLRHWNPGVDPLETIADVASRPLAEPPIPIDSARGLALFFNNDVLVWGTHTGRVTVATQSPGFAEGAADITIMSSVGPASTPMTMPGTAGTVVDNVNTSGSALALIAQGNIVLNQTQSNPCEVRRVHASLIAETGTVTIPPIWATRVYQKNAPVCPDITLGGSIAANLAPVLNWKWDAGTPEYAGYMTRKLYWDSTLRTVVPPYFPKTGLWSNDGFSEANKDCVRSTNPVCQ